MKKYTIIEIDEMRKLVREIDFLVNRSFFHPHGVISGWNDWKLQEITHEFYEFKKFEELIRSYMSQGVTVNDLLEKKKIAQKEYDERYAAYQEQENIRRKREKENYEKAKQKFADKKGISIDDVENFNGHGYRIDFPEEIDGYRFQKKLKNVTVYPITNIDKNQKQIIISANDAASAHVDHEWGWLGRKICKIFQ